MNHTNRYLRNFKPYKLASHKIWNVSEKERNSVLKLDWNESTQNPTPLVRKRLMNIISNNNFFNFYPSTYNDKLYELLSNYVGLKKENIQYFGSSDSLHEYIAKLFITVGDPVVIIWPSYDNFRLTIEVSGGIIHYFEYDDEFNFNSKNFIDFIDKISPSLVYICNPNNPTGYLHKSKFIETLLIKFPETMFLVDEAYYEFCGVSCSKLVLKYENILISRTMSKAFGIANFRFGYLIASKKNISYISNIRNPKNITTIAQEAAIAVLSDIPYMNKYVKEVNKAKKTFIESFNHSKHIKIFPSAGNFVLMKFQNYKTKMNLYYYLQQKNIFLRNVEQSNSLLNCLRITIGTPKQMEYVAKIIIEFFKDE